MKELFRFAKLALLSFVLVIVSGCQTPVWMHDTGARRFEETEQVDVVLRFARWDYITISRPDYREAGYIRFLRRDELGKTFDHLGLHRNTAVVVVGWSYQEDMLTQVVSDWKTVLRQCGFRRVICLRGSGGDNINGLPILEDADLTIGQPRQSAKL